MRDDTGNLFSVLSVVVGIRGDSARALAGARGLTGQIG